MSTDRPGETASDRLAAHYAADPADFATSLKAGGLPFTKGAMGERRVPAVSQEEVARETGELIDRLMAMYSHRGDGIPTQFVNPDGPEAARLIASQAEEIERWINSHRLAFEQAMSNGSALQAEREAKEAAEAKVAELAEEIRIAAAHAEEESQRAEAAEADAARLREAADTAFEFLGGVDDASEVRATLLDALRPSGQEGGER